MWKSSDGFCCSFLYPVLQYVLQYVWGQNTADFPTDSSVFMQVNLKEQGQLIRQDEFLVSFRKKKCYRHIFLFQDLILFSKTKKTEVGNDTYIYKQSFKVVSSHTDISTAAFKKHVLCTKI